MQKAIAKSIVAGILLALLLIKTFIMFTSPIAYQLFALFLGFTACTYLGAALSDTRLKWISVEFAMSMLFFTFAALGLIYSPIWLASGFILHGLWDTLHHPKMIKTKIIKWFPPLCAIFDIIVAVFILTFY